MSAPARAPRTVAVVPAHDGRELLPACLAALHAQRGAAFAAVVLVDDGSRDGTAAWLAATHPEVELVRRGARGGFARAANDGLARAAALGADLVALVNTDVELAPDWLRTATAAIGPADASVATKMVRADDPGVIDDAGDRLRRDGVCEQRGRGHRDDGRLDAAGEAWGACAGAALYRLHAVRAVGAFDITYGQYLEDVDLALRLRLAGWTCAYAPAVARHAGGASAGGLPAPVRYWTARGSLLLVLTWFPWRWAPMVAYRQASWLVDAARAGPAALGWHVRGAAAGAVAGLRRRWTPAARRARRPRTAAAVRGDAPGGAGAAGRGYVRALSVAEVVPAVPWRGPAAGGHPAADR